MAVLNEARNILQPAEFSSPPAAKKPADTVPVPPPKLLPDDPDPDTMVADAASSPESIVAALKEQEEAAAETDDSGVIDDAADLKQVTEFQLPEDTVQKVVEAVEAQSSATDSEAVATETTVGESDVEASDPEPKNVTRTPLTLGEPEKVEVNGQMTEAVFGSEALKFGQYNYKLSVKMEVIFRKKSYGVKEIDPVITKVVREEYTQDDEKVTNYDITGAARFLFMNLFPETTKWTPEMRAEVYPLLIAGEEKVIYELEIPHPLKPGEMTTKEFIFTRIDDAEKEN